MYTTFQASQEVLVVKKLPANAGDIRNADSTPRLGRSLGGVHSNPLQYSYLENPMDRGAWWAIILRVAKCQTGLKQLSTHVYNFPIPGSGRTPGEGNGNPLQYPCLENPMDGATVGYGPRLTQSQT